MSLNLKIEDIKDIFGFSGNIKGFSKKCSFDKAYEEIEDFLKKYSKTAQVVLFNYEINHTNYIFEFHSKIVPLIADNLSYLMTVDDNKNIKSSEVKVTILLTGIK
jgi:hypothetical protein